MAAAGRVGANDHHSRGGHRFPTGGQSVRSTTTTSFDGGERLRSTVPTNQRMSRVPMLAKGTALGPRLGNLRREQRVEIRDFGAVDYQNAEAARDGHSSARRGRTH